jgi:UDP-glucuronate 4-epimerase
MTDRGPILVTGAAGFIGFHTTNALLDRGEVVVGIDNLNDYYSVKLKEDRLAKLSGREGFCFRQVDLCDGAGLASMFAEANPVAVINLAAQVGVRNSLENAFAYVESNVVGFLNILEACRRHDVRHLVYASSSSVYGNNAKLPFSTADNVDYPISLYAATKKADELMAHTYSHLYGLPTTGLRFFTVYGPWGRPDMAMFLFTKALFEERPIRLFNAGKMLRDFTYVSDIVNGLLRVLDRAPSPDNAPPDRPGASPHYRIYNIGNSAPIEVSHLIRTLERLTGRTANLEILPMQPGEVPSTFADVEDLQRDVDFIPSTPIEVGAARFVEWYREYYGVA